MVKQFINYLFIIDCEGYLYIKKMDSLSRNIQNLKTFQGRQRLAGDRNSQSGRDWATVDKRLLNFIWAHNDLVDKDILERLNVKEEAAVHEALEQIHYRSLGSTGNTYNNGLGSGKKYSEAVMGFGERNPPWQQVSHKKTRKTGGRSKLEQIVTIFLHNIPDEATGRDIWKLFGSCGKIIDIILPRKRDRNGKRYGFVKTTTELEAGAIINNAKMEKKLGSRISMSLNKVARGVQVGYGSKPADKGVADIKDKGVADKKVEEDVSFGKKIV